MADNQKNHRNSVANDFRSYADRDYIAARTLFRNECLDQFLYIAQQCLEKYLKSILLYHDVRIKKGIHTLQELLGLCKKEIRYFVISKQGEGLIKNLNNYNLVRYPDFPFYAERGWLFDLDHSVKELRFFAQSNNNEVFNRFEKLGKKKLDEQYLFNPKKNLFLSGYLEKVLKNRNKKHSLERSSLIWKNFYFGSRRKGKIKFNGGFWSKNNYIFAGHTKWQKEVYDAIKDFIFLPKDAKTYFDSIKL